MYENKIFKRDACKEVTRGRVPDGSSECCHFEKTKDTTDY